MGVFNPTLLINAFNLAVNRHLESKKAKSQLRPKFFSIVGPLPPNNDLPGVTCYRLWYENGLNFAMAEADIASVVHSYTSLVAQEVGDPDLIESSYFDSPVSQSRTKGR